MEKIFYLIRELYKQHEGTLTAKGKVLTCILVLMDDMIVLISGIDNTKKKNPFQLFYVTCYIVWSGKHLTSCTVITYNLPD